MFLSEICTLRPRFEGAQKKLLQWLRHAHELQNNNEAIDFLSRLEKNSSPILNRGFELEKFNQPPQKNLKMSLDEQMAFYQKTSIEQFRNFYPGEAKLPPHLFHVSCTGYHSPSAAQALVSEKNAGEKTTVTHLYHMGCYASIPAIRLACATLSNDPKTQVDIVHTELCTLHFNPTQKSLDQLVVQTLFADGHAKYSLTKEKPKSDCLEVLALHEVIVSETQDQMTWYPAQNGFQMTLSREIPKSISSQIKSFVVTLLKKASVHIEEYPKIIFAIHPGGIKIIDQVAKTLELEPAQIEMSKTVLKNCGNMSSSTLPYLWKGILENCAQDTTVVSLAFGPGLTICGAVFRASKGA